MHNSYIHPIDFHEAFNYIMCKYGLLNNNQVTGLIFFMQIIVLIILLNISAAPED